MEAADSTEELCPIITPYTRTVGIKDETLGRLFKVRQWRIPEDGAIPFKWPSKLRHTIWSPLHKCDTGITLEPKQYQLQMAHHLSRMPRFINGDSVGLGKTLETIIANTWLHDRVPGLKTIIFATKSTVYQWAEEFERFSHLRPMVMQDKYKGLKSYEARYAQLQDFLTDDTHDILICKYSSMIGKRRKIDAKYDEDGIPTYKGRERIAHEVKEFLKIIKPHGARTLMVFDECQKFKTVGSGTRSMVEILARPCGRVWALTATVIKNGIDEFYSIAHAIGIRPFGSIAEFEEDFCIFKMIYVGKGRQKRALEGYKNVARFKTGMRPFFLGRSQRQVKEKLPRLTTVIHPIDLDDEQTKLLLEDIPSGKFQLPPSVMKVAGEIVTKDRDPNNEMTMLSVYQLVANHPALLDPADLKRFHSSALSPKEEALLDMLDGDLRGEKVIVFTKSRSWIDRLEYLTKEGKFTERKFLRITGAENETKRERNKQLFQDPGGEHDLIFINAAATEGVNLQQAAHMIILDPPWSWGDLLQLVGRMVRMASPHSACTLHVLSARGSVDEYAIETLQCKKGVFEKILGESHSAGLLDDREIFDMASGMEQSAKDEEFWDMLKAHVKKLKLMTFIKGKQLADAQGIELTPDEPTEGTKKKVKVKPDPMASIEDHMAKWGL